MKPNGNHEPMLNSLRTHKARRQERDKAGEGSVLRNLGNVGALGWLIVTPILAGLALGRWLDSWLGSGIACTGGLLTVGAAFGWWLAWRRMHQP